MTTVANFSIDYLQILNEHGELVADLPTFATPAKLIELYELMNLVRVFDTKAIVLQRTGKMGTYASTLGQEAIGTAIGNSMRAEDVFCPFYRDYATPLQRGTKMQHIFQYWGGDERGSYGNEQSQDFPICVPIATQCLHAAGVARAFQIRGQQRVAVTIIGDGGTSEGNFYEAINVAGAWQLPAVFVIHNNQWAISIPRDTQTGAQTLAQKGIAGGIHCLQVDGNDVIAMQQAMLTALQHAREGHGATLIEAVSYRLCDHTTADDARRYREQAEVDAAWQREPLKRLRSYLESIKAWDADQEQALLSRCQQEVERAVEAYLNTPPQPTNAMFAYMYEQLPQELQQQCQQAEQWWDKS